MVRRRLKPDVHVQPLEGPDGLRQGGHQESVQTLPRMKLLLFRLLQGIIFSPKNNSAVHQLFLYNPT